VGGLDGATGYLLARGWLGIPTGKVIASNARDAIVVPLGAGFFYFLRALLTWVSVSLHLWRLHYLVNVLQVYPGTHPVQPVLELSEALCTVDLSMFRFFLRFSQDNLSEVVVNHVHDWELAAMDAIGQDIENGASAVAAPAPPGMGRFSFVSKEDISVAVALDASPTTGVFATSRWFEAGGLTVVLVVGFSFARGWGYVMEPGALAAYPLSWTRRTRNRDTGSHWK